MGTWRFSLGARRRTDPRSLIPDPESLIPESPFPSNRRELILQPMLGDLAAQLDARFGGEAIVEAGPDPGVHDVLA